MTGERRCSCGAEIEVEVDLPPSKGGALRRRVIFECGGEVTLQKVKDYWRMRTHPVCGAQDPEEEDVV